MTIKSNSSPKRYLSYEYSIVYFKSNNNIVNEEKILKICYEINLLTLKLLQLAENFF